MGNPWSCLQDLEVTLCSKNCTQCSWDTFCTSLPLCLCALSPSSPPSNPACTTVPCGPARSPGPPRGLSGPLKLGPPLAARHRRRCLRRSEGLGRPARTAPQQAIATNLLNYQATDPPQRLILSLDVNLQRCGQTTLVLSLQSGQVKISLMLKDICFEGQNQPSCTWVPLSSSNCPQRSCRWLLLFLWAFRAASAWQAPSWPHRIAHPPLRRCAL